METDTVFTVYKQGPERKNFDAIVIGSGMGGLGCAAALSSYGRRVLVLEQHYNAGGFSHTFTRKGYRWDVGVHCVGEMGARQLPGKLLSWLSGDRIKMAPIGKAYDTAYFPDGSVFPYPDRWREFRAKLEADFPGEKTAIGEYFGRIWSASSSARYYLLLRTLPPRARKLALKLFLKRQPDWTRTTSEVLDSLTGNERLKAVLTAQWGAYGVTPDRSSFALHALVIRHFWNGGYFPEGGSQTMVTELLKTIRDAGGETWVRASVEQILMEKGRAVGVRLQSGEEIRAKSVISAAGARTTVERLLPEPARAKPWAREISGIPQSLGIVCLNLGLQGDIRAAGGTPSNQWLFEGWDMEDAWWDVNKPDSVAPALYVSFSSLKDPAHDPGPEQRHTVEVITFVPWDAFSKWQNTRRGNRDPEYLAFKKKLEERLLAQLRKHLPKLVDLVQHHELATPLSVAHFTRAPQGAIYGLEATPERFRSPHLGTRTPIKGLYMAGGDVAILGVTGALVGGVLAAATLEPRVYGKFL
jgi:all-trans-retinol 13,14-reductase